MAREPKTKPFSKMTFEERVAHVWDSMTPEEQQAAREGLEADRELKASRGANKFNQARHKPPGNLTPATLATEIVGARYRMAAAMAFVEAATKADADGRRYGVDLVREPGNPHDPNAIKVMGWIERKGFLWGTARDSWHVGYVPAETAEYLVDEYYAVNIRVQAELYSMYRRFDGGELPDMKFIALVPHGEGMQERSRAAGSPRAGR